MDTKALRQKILDLAIRGKLVPQDPADEPASVLLERIRAEKQQMVKDGKLKAKDIKNDTVIYVGEDNLHYEKYSDGTVKCIEDEIPFEIPDGWAWARVFNVSTDLPYGTAKKSYAAGKMAVLRMGNLQNGEIDYRDLVYSSDEEDIAKYSLCPGDLLFNRTNSAELVGKTAIYRGSVPAIYAGYLIRIHPLVDPEYLNAVMNSQYAKQYCYYVKADSVSQSNINANKLGAFLIPIPPVNEQKSISKEVSVFLPIISALQEHEAQIKELCVEAKSKILDLAIRGKLVPQDPADEPASVLLERIRADKEEQIKAGKIKRDKKESFIFRGEDNSYYLSRSTHKEQVDAQFIFPLPPGWQWCTLSNISHFELGKTLDQGKNTGNYCPYLRSANIKWDSIDLSDLKEMRFEKEELERYTIIKNDLLICEGGDVGRCCVWESTDTIMYQNALHRVRFFENCNPFFFMFYMWHYELEGMLKPICNGVTIKHLTGDVLRSIPFALPPVEEQKRIVAKIREYFKVIDILQ